MQTRSTSGTRFLWCARVSMEITQPQWTFIVQFSLSTGRVMSSSTPTRNPPPSKLVYGFPNLVYPHYINEAHQRLYRVPHIIRRLSDAGRGFRRCKGYCRTGGSESRWASHRRGRNPCSAWTWCRREHRASSNFRTCRPCQESDPPNDEADA